MNIKILTFLVIGVLVVVAGSNSAILSDKIGMLKNISTSESTQVAEVVSTPTPEPEPSERSLKVAAFAFVRMDKEKQNEFKKTYGDETLSNAEFIKQWAIRMDKNPALLAQNEAIMQRVMATEGQSVQTNYYEQPTSYSESTGTTIDTFEQQKQQRRAEQQQECQKKMTEYNSCIGEYNTKLGEYNSCLMEGNKYSYCSKPTKFCSKPYCF